MAESRAFRRRCVAGAMRADRVRGDADSSPRLESPRSHTLIAHRPPGCPCRRGQRESALEARFSRRRARRRGVVAKPVRAHRLAVLCDDPSVALAAPIARFYDELAEWWPLFSPPSHYVEEGEDLLRRLAPAIGRGASTLLELGSGGGSLASHLKPHFRLTLTDRSNGMLDASRAVNPEAEHISGDMRSIRLDREFDVVMVHDAISYATQPEDVQATLHTAAVQCRPGGTVIVLPDYMRETFAPGTGHGGEDAPDGRGFRYLEWHWDPDPSDHTYVVDYAFMLREADGRVRVEHDRHVEGLFARADWQGWFAAAGLDATSEIDQWGRDVFIAIRRRA